MAPIVTTMLDTDLAEQLRARLCCPRCHAGLSWAADHVTCTSCHVRYAIEDGIPVLVAPGRDIRDDELDHDHGAHNRSQAAWFDHAAQAEFEIDRPHRTPRLYAWLLQGKARRALDPIGNDLSGSTAIVICGGSGMDAEFLAARGARVITSDISIGAAKRAAERSRRYGVPFLSIVADAEQLPLLDRSIDLAYVHDGLHHLADPTLAMNEMARVSARWVAITEPARAGLTRLAVRLGLALDREPAGNRVIRFDPASVTRHLGSQGFGQLRAARYAMFYRHQPGRIMSLLSLPGVIAVSKAGYRLADRILGRAGNKLVIVASRRPVGPISRS